MTEVTPNLPNFKSSPFRELLQILFYGNSATGNALLYISLLSVAFGRVRPGGRTLFVFGLIPIDSASYRILHAKIFDILKVLYPSD